jgi:hypothetical protein
MSKEQTVRLISRRSLPQRRQCVSASETAAAVGALCNHVKQRVGASQAPRKTLKLNSPLSSLLQVRLSLIFQLRHPG